MRGRVSKKIKKQAKHYIVIETEKEPPFLRGQTVKIIESYSEKQLRFIHAIFGDISEQCGYTPLEVKTMMKGLAEVDSVATADKEDMDRLIDTTIEFVRTHDITLSKKTIQDMDAERHIKICLYKEVCLLCGESADKHHADRVGMGRDRKEEEPGKVPLCRKHHTELHTIGDISFMGLYHLGREYNKYFLREALR